MELHFLSHHAHELTQEFLRQLSYVMVAVSMAIILGMPLGICVAKKPILRKFALKFSAILWTIPSLAMLAFLIPWVGIGPLPAIIALSVYALLPILRAVVTGLNSLSVDTLDAANGMGFSSVQRLLMIELPLAMPVILAGIRNAITISVGIATLAAFIGAGGLGAFINRGLAMNDTRLILLGAIPTALMAVGLDFLFSFIEALYKCVQCRGDAQRKRTVMKSLLLIGTSAMFCLSIYSGLWASFDSGSSTIRIASKDFTEQVILGEIAAELIEAKTQLQVVRKFGLGSTGLMQAAMQQGAIDIYPEYSGTAYMTVLHQRYQPMSPEKIFDQVKHDYASRYDIEWLPPLGFANSEVIAVPRDWAFANKVTNLTELASQSPAMSLAATTEYVTREDCLPLLKKFYRLKFSTIQSLHPGLIFNAIAQKRVNAIAAFSTDPRLQQNQLTILKDDQHVMPPYQAAYLVRRASAKRFPEVSQVLHLLDHRISQGAIQHMNAEVDIEHHTVQQVAHEFLTQQHLI